MAEADGHYENLTVEDQTYETLVLDQVEETYDTLQTKTRKKDLLRLLRSDIRRNKRFGAGLGVFCVVLALLNVAVPLHLHQSNMVERQQLQSRLEQIQNTNLNLTEKKGQLETRCDVLQTTLDLLETSYDQLNTSYDQLNTRCDKLETRCDKLETIRYELPLEERENMTKERDELEMRLCLLTLTELVCESPEWQKFDSRCYYISTEERTWEASREWCRDHQSDLVVIKSKEQHDFVVSLMTKVKESYVWLGLTDKVVEGSFVWVDGTPLTTPTYWMPGQPDGETISFPDAEMDCIYYVQGFGDTPTPGWFDGRCHYPNYWMCERSLC